MRAAIYILTTLTTLLCAVMLLRAYVNTRTRLLFWSGLCFVGLTVNNILVYVDLIVYPQVDMYTERLAVAAISMTLLIFGLIWESQ